MLLQKRSIALKKKQIKKYYNENIEKCYNDGYTAGYEAGYSDAMERMGELTHLILNGE